MISSSKSSRCCELCSRQYKNEQWEHLCMAIFWHWISFIVDNWYVHLFTFVSLFCLFEVSFEALNEISEIESILIMSRSNIIVWILRFHDRYKTFFMYLPVDRVITDDLLQSVSSIDAMSPSSHNNGECAGRVCLWTCCLVEFSWIVVLWIFSKTR